MPQSTCTPDFVDAPAGTQLPGTPKVKANGTARYAFDVGNYEPHRDDRLRTLFWLPEVLTDPDAIYPNAHKIVAGDQVYVRVYDKMGSTVKLAFTKDVTKRGVVIQTVLITSFLTDPKTAMSYVRGQPIYQRPKAK